MDAGGHGRHCLDTMGAQHDGGPVVLAIEDSTILASLREPLLGTEVLPIAARTAEKAFEAIDFHRPSVAVIDVGMQEGRGWELLYAVAERAGLSVLALDPRGDPLARRGALAAGADDVVGPPIDPDEVTARVVRLARRQRIEERASATFRYGDLVVDVAAHETRVDGAPIALTAQQFGILRALCEARGATLERSQLLARIAPVDDEPASDRAIDLHVSRLRRRLGPKAGALIESVYGIGYRLRATPAPPIPAEAAAAVIDALEDPIVVVDATLRISAANRAARRLLDREDVVGRPCAEVFRCRTADGRSIDGPLCLGRAALAGGGAVPRIEAVVGDGVQAHVDLCHTAVEAGGSRLVAIEIRRQG